jgi:hypothetical protein
MVQPLLTRVAVDWHNKYGTLGPGNWHTNAAAWDANRYVMEFWAILERRLLNQYGNGTPPTLMSDILDVGLESLIVTSQMFHAWCGERGLDAADKPLFWSVVKRRTTWEVTDFFSARFKDPESLDTLVDAEVPDEDLIRTQLNMHQSVSFTHEQIARFITTLSPRDQLFLAMRIFEEMPVAELAKMNSTSGASVSAAVMRSTKQVLAYSLTMVSDLEMPERSKYSVPSTRIPQQMTDWISAKYGLALDDYLQYVACCYKADVSYLVDMIDTANGHRRKVPAARKYKLTPDQRAEVDARIANGESFTSISQDYDISNHSISAQARARGAA